MPDAVNLTDLSRSYGEVQALRNVTLNVREGLLYGLLGPNGSGKTTLFRILCTLLEPSQGRAQVFGTDVVQSPALVRQQIGVVYQEPALDERLTVKENLRFHAALYGLRGSALNKRMRSLLLDLGVAERANDRVDTLSGGLRRRVDLVRGLLHSPRLLLLDEPTTGLDPGARHSLWKHLKKLQREEGTTLLVATHLMEEAEKCDRVAILNEGELVADGSPSSLKSDLGGDMLWIATSHPESLSKKIKAQFGLTVTRIESSLQVQHPDPPTILPRLYEAFGDEMTSATIRQPSLEDVFMVKTGYRLQSEPQGLKQELSS